MPERPTTIAFYLPQFYPIPENEAWYGPGFTEWHNVVQARALFPGHYQPHLPREFGFYDLRVPEVREAQARSAKAHGIDAFCYYHYWFEGHRPLRRVVDDLLNHGTPDIPFCLAWANENWSRHWDATQHEVLLRQRYNASDDEAHARFLLQAMAHPLYLRIDGKPVFFIYRIQGMPDPVRTIERWREMWTAEGLSDAHIVKLDTHDDFSDPAALGADSAAQFLPHGTHERVARIQPMGADPGDIVFDYEDVVRYYLSVTQPTWRRHECVVPTWDNSPRRGRGRSLLLHNSAPELFEEWLRTVHGRTPSDGMVLINAWNEWAEGAHLEPDLAHGDAYLKATARALGAKPQHEVEEALTPLALVPFELRDRFAELYLDSVATQTVLRRRLSRMEAMLERQIEIARSEAQAEAAQARADAAVVLQAYERLRAESSMPSEPVFPANVD